MKQRILFLLLGFLGLVLPAPAFAQGCSDAGVCTAGALQYHAPADSAKQRSIGLSLTAGSGEQGVRIGILQLEWKQRLFRSWDLEIKLPYYLATGDLGTHSGPGDPIIAGTRSWAMGGAWTAAATLGTRFSLTNAGASDSKGRPLPMPYQQGLGTTDLICGLSAQYRQWLFISAGYQQPLVQYNANGYLNTALPAAEPEYGAYFSSRRLDRRGDLLLRADAAYRPGPWMLSGGPLLIYHLGQDRITTEAERTMAVPGSEGLTLNLAVRLAYTRQGSRWELGGGTPMIVRQVRPDGLTREWVLTLRYERALR